MIQYSFRFLVVALPFALSSCGLYDWADANMPVIGQRCEHWQCFTQSGQEQSNINEQERLHEATQANGSTGAATATPDATSNSATPPGQPVAPPMPEEGAYKYVPRAPAPPGTTPFDGQSQAPQ